MHVLIFWWSRSIIKFFLFGSSSLFFVLHFLCKFCFNNGKGQVKQEESSNENDWVEVDDYPNTNRLLERDHECSPALHCDYLKYLKHWKHDIVKVTGSICRVFIRLCTICPWEARFLSSANVLSWIYKSSIHEVASVLVSASEQLGSGDCKNKEKEEKHEQRVSKQGDSVDQRRNDNS